MNELKRLCALLIGIVFLILAPPATAQVKGLPSPSVEKAEPKTAADIAPLSDEEVRRLLLEKLSDEPKARQRGVFNPANAAHQFQLAFSRAHKHAGEIFGSYTQLPALPGKWWERMTKGRDGRAIGKFVVVALLSFGIGLYGAHLLRRRLHRSSRLSVAESPAGEPGRIAWFFGRLLSEALAAAVMAALATAAFSLLLPGDSRDRTLFFFYLAGIVIVLLISGLSRTVFAPTNWGQRLPAMDDAQATRLHNSISATAAISVFAFFSCASFSAVGIGGAVHDLLLILVGMLTALLLSATIWASRGAIRSDILAGAREPGPLRRMVARIWPSTFALVPLLSYAFVLINVFLGNQPLYGGGLLTFLVLLLVPIVESALSRTAIRFDDRGEALGAAFARVGRIALPAIAVSMLAAGWRVDLLPMAEETWTARAVHALVEVAVILFVAYALWQAIRIAIDRQIDTEDAAYAAEHGADAMEAEQGGAGLSRARTLLPLAKRAVLIALGTLVLLVALSALGVDTGPLLAGAGVVGLAIGFGSQTLVRDIVTGFFFLMEDAFRIGEYLDVGSVKGTVEEISIRSMKLRHHRGALNTVPFGAVDVIQNFSRDWAIMKLRVRVPFETDLNKVRKLLKKVGQEMMQEEAIAGDFLQPFKAQGAVEVDDYGFVISTKFMCKPGKQFVIRRFAFQAMQDAFEAENIPFAKPQVRVVVETADDAEERPGDALGAAAGAASSIVSREPTIPEHSTVR